MGNLYTKVFTICLTENAAWLKQASTFYLIGFHVTNLMWKQYSWICEIYKISLTVKIMNFV
jgi:hypothetical protein